MIEWERRKAFPASGWIIKVTFCCRPRSILPSSTSPTIYAHHQREIALEQYLIYQLYQFYTVTRPSFTPNWPWWLRSPHSAVGSNHHATPSTPTTTTTMAPTEWDPLLPNGNRQTGRNYTGILTKTTVYGITLVMFLIGGCFLLNCDALRLSPLRHRIHTYNEEVADEVLQPTHSPFRRLFCRTGSVITARRYFYNYSHIHFPINGTDMTSHRYTTPTVSIAAAPL